VKFATRTFLLSFLPFVLLLGGSFWYIHRRVETEVRENLSANLRQAAVSMEQLRKKSDLQGNGLLPIVGENAALKNGVQLMLSDRKNPAARLTLEDQLREICDELHFDYMMVSSPDNKALAGVFRVGNELMVMSIGNDIGRIKPPPQHGFWSFNDKMFQIASVPINQGDENIGTLSVGENFSLSEFSTPVVLTLNGKVVAYQLPGGVTQADVDAAMSQCSSGGSECDVRLRGETYLTLPSTSIDYGQGYTLRTMQNVDTATGPILKALETVFVVAGFFAILLALLMTAVSSRSIVQPLAGVVERLKQSEQTGLLPEFQAGQTTVLEIRELTESFNRAGASIRDARERLQGAYVQFVGSLAGALDARDTYTAGHSRRVSEYACLIAGLLGEELEDIRIGAILHDFGKVGIPDAVLQKPGRLSAEEFAILKQHPVIGRRILEGVAGFQAYLPVVELHHENWDGTGYPSGLRGEQVPLFARIVHVADAYDAMTSDRPYRRGLSHEQAVAELIKFAGSQFDPTIVSVFVKADLPGIMRRSSEDDPALGLHIV
jgi:HD-GYP domain-containing protein (c-di-GMP phosphodiesterase class II)